MSTAQEFLSTLALSAVPGIGIGRARKLIDWLGSAEAVFAGVKELAHPPYHVPASILSALKQKDKWIKEAEKEWDFAERNGISCLLPQDSQYPTRLIDCPDAPLYLFYKGEASLNPTHCISIVGTRHATTYGEELCKRFLSDLSELAPSTLIVSGLAYGIDIHAHRVALQAGLPTVAVLAHGLDRIYPSLHRDTARQMMKQGGLLTEFTSGTNPDRQNFVMRNRIVAGMSEATIVVESAEKGGALITAELANSYNRDCFAFPGRITDPMSAGCHKLIAENKAALIQSAEDFVKFMRWDTVEPTAPVIQRELFPELSTEEQQIVNLLQEKGALQLNLIAIESGFPISLLSSILFSLEMQGVIRQSAGNVYTLC